MELVDSVDIAAPIERCFDITRSIEMHEDSSTLIDGRAVGGRCVGLAEVGDETTWSARFFGLRFRLCVRVVEMVAPQTFREEMVRGLMRSFGHVYQLESLEDGRTRLTDRFWFVLPLGPLGRWVARVFLAGKMRKVQHHRLQQIQQVCESAAWKRYLEGGSELL